MSSTLRIALLVGLFVASLALSREGHASCVAPQPEAALLTTPTGATVPAGGSLLMYLSDTAMHTGIGLEPEGGGAAVSLARRELAPHVFALFVPAQTPAGRYAVVARAAGRQQQAPWTAGQITVGGTLVTRTLPTPSGRLELRSSPGRWAPNQSVVLALSTPAPPDVGVVFRWTDAGTTFGSARWVGAEELSPVASGHCGTYPFGTRVPTAGTTFEVAYVDAQGVLGPWASLTVGR
ncbi:MAG: hypothetical protein K1X94_36045 [Sandaracinaceae bacterium]|nr:hypothetical protein [Sandaracinaceae bacterium]